VIRAKPPREASGAVYTDGGAERAKAIAHYGNPRTAKETFPFEAYGDVRVRHALNEAFGFKCAYCETYYGASQPVAVEHFRPKGGYLVKGKLRRPGYYWLAAAWDNLLPSCTDCNSARTQKLSDGTTLVVGKADQFPLESERVRARKPGQERKERRLLLHPYHDDPRKHLVFSEGGIVTWKRPGGRPSRKAQESIRVYALLRDGLVRARVALEKQLKVQMAITEDLVVALAAAPRNAALHRALDHQLELLESYTKPDQEYSEMARQLLEPFLRKLAGR
jgi:uncharacterized protein (TIGR02646 family)